MAHALSLKLARNINSLLHNVVRFLLLIACTLKTLQYTRLIQAPLRCKFCAYGYFAHFTFFLKHAAPRGSRTLNLKINRGSLRFFDFHSCKMGFAGDAE